MNQTKQTTSRPSWAQVGRTTLLALLGGVAGNLIVWFVSSVVGEIRVDLLDVVLFSVLGAVAGGVLYRLLAWPFPDAQRRNRVFVAICILVLVVYAGAPIAATTAPYKQGAQPFNLLTVVATEIMHLVSGGFVIAAFTRSASQ
ncbi:MAG: hypothetical protein NZL91_04435 [Thermoflexales bacterium]|nr:hypothetical protein [Thermoflexales bacterium]MDW8394770.1 hypothetical protein [Anaerolineae bacterium]